MLFVTVFLMLQKNYQGIVRKQIIQFFSTENVTSLFKRILDKTVLTQLLINLLGNPILFDIFFEWLVSVSNLEDSLRLRLHASEKLRNSKVKAGSILYLETAKVRNHFAKSWFVVNRRFKTFSDLDTEISVNRSGLWLYVLYLILIFMCLELQIWSFSKMPWRWKQSKYIENISPVM